MRVTIRLLSGSLIGGCGSFVIAVRYRIKFRDHLVRFLRLLLDQVFGFTRIVGKIEQMIGLGKTFAFWLLPTAGAVGENQFPVAVTNGQKTAAALMNDGRTFFGRRFALQGAGKTETVFGTGGVEFGSAILATVARMSVWQIDFSQRELALTFFGQRTKNGTRWPPSQISALVPRRAPLEVCVSG